MSEPRQLEEIKKEYADTLVKVGQAQYQREVMDREVKTLNDRLYAINIEASKRNELDKTGTPVGATKENPTPSGEAAEPTDV